MTTDQRIEDLCQTMETSPSPVARDYGKSLRKILTAGRVGEQPTPDARGFSMWFDREQWGAIMDGLIAELDISRKRRAANSESTSDIRAEMCADLLGRIGAAGSTVPTPDDTATMTMHAYPLNDGGWALTIMTIDGRMDVEYDADFDVTASWMKHDRTHLSAESVHVGPVAAAVGGDLPKVAIHNSDHNPASEIKSGDLPKPDEATPKITVTLYGGPWAGTIEVDRVVGPVLGVGDSIGNHYWLDTKSDPPAYHWDDFAASPGPEREYVKRQESPRASLGVPEQQKEQP